VQNVLVFPTSLFSTKPPPPKTNAWGSAEAVATASPAETGKAETPSGPSVFDRLTNPERFPKRHRDRFLGDDKKDVGEPTKAAGGTSPRTRVAKGPGGFRITPSSGIPSLEELPPPKSKAHRKRASTEQAPNEAVVHEHPSQTMPSETSASTAPAEVGSTVFLQRAASSSGFDPVLSRSPVFSPTLVSIFCQRAQPAAIRGRGGRRNEATSKLLAKQSPQSDEEEFDEDAADSEGAASVTSSTPSSLLNVNRQRYGVLATEEGLWMTPCHFAHSMCAPSTLGFTNASPARRDVSRSELHSRCDSLTVARHIALGRFSNLPCVRVCVCVAVPDCQHRHPSRHAQERQDEANDEVAARQQRREEAQRRAREEVERALGPAFTQEAPSAVAKPISASGRRQLPVVSRIACHC
jgi:hypothetical protein